jgi:glycosyltransferase involved in cell wall biosynthesis
MKVGIVSDGYLDRPGGVEKTIIAAISALNEGKFEVHLCCIKKPDINRIYHLFGKRIEIRKEYTIPQLKIPYVHSLSRFLLIKPFWEMINNVDYVIDINGGLLDRFIPHNFSIENYIIYRLGMPLTEQAFANRYLLQKFLGMTYLKTIYKLLKPSENVRILSANKSTARALHDRWGLKTYKILYPPVFVNSFQYDGKPKNKNSIISLGRFSPEKNFEFAVEVINKLSKRIRDIKLTIVGGVYIKETSEWYIKKLQEKVAKLKLQKHINFCINVKQREMRQMLNESKIFLSTQVKSDSFQIAIIEGMASGCIPVVPKCGGAWEEIVEMGRYGFGYRDVEECANIIESILNDEDLADKYVNISIKRSNYFSESAFKDRFIKIIEERVNEVK